MWWVNVELDATIKKKLKVEMKYKVDSPTYKFRIGMGLK